eukprot:gene53316-65219_t
MRAALCAAALAQHHHVVHAAHDPNHHQLVRDCGSDTRNPQHRVIEVHNGCAGWVHLRDFIIALVRDAPENHGQAEFWVLFPENANVTPGGSWVICHDATQTDDHIRRECDESRIMDHWTGNDGTSEKHMTWIDCVGDFLGYPGPGGWDVCGVKDATRNHTLRRRCDIVRGNPVWSRSSS